ncbi:peptidoglycan bridge formation glycyltransferase FemA/FemB family protein [Candidatus Saccharibacteria bacterium]|nr:peptidoglycan bridge formation glycyltransferase FemA/FemB family protein [Candidatus Saccharibacteria bacterium]
MKFTTLEPAEFTKFATKSPYKSFLQTVEIATLRSKNGWTPYYFGVEEDGKIIAATMAVAKPTFLGKSTYFIPGGPLLDYEDTALVNFFFKNLNNYAKSHNGYILHIEPYYEIIERDQDGEIVAGGFNREKAKSNLRDLGFQPATPENPAYLFVLELKNRKYDELFASFKQNTRNLINRTARKGVKIRELKREELDKFKQITESTSERRHFTDKTLDYYETMYDLFAKKGEVKFIVAEISEMESEESKGVHSRHFATNEEQVSEGSPVTTGRAERVENESLLTPIAVAMFITYGDEVIYLFSGSDAKYMKEYNAQYAIQWHMIQYALKNKFKRYNFYGIQGLPDPAKPGYGIYKFKKGFTTAKTGRVIELLGAYELPINQTFYRLHSLLTKLKHH